MMGLNAQGCPARYSTLGARNQIDLSLAHPRRIVVHAAAVFIPPPPSPRHMTGYGIALFFHTLGFGLAAGAVALVKVALSRTYGARTVGEMLRWHLLLAKTTPLFPISLAILLLSGGYMVSASDLSWSTAFVTAGLIAVAVLFAVGGFLGAKGRTFARRLETLAAADPDQAPPTPEPSFTPTLSFGNVGLVIGVIFDMATKQASLPIALGALAIGFTAGALTGRRLYAGDRRTAAKPAIAADGAY